MARDLLFTDLLGVLPKCETSMLVSTACLRTPAHCFILCALTCLMGPLAWVVPSLCHAQDGDLVLETSTRQMQLGEMKIGVATTEAKGSKFVYVNLHDDENTSAQAGLNVLKRTGGRLVELRHSGQRDLTFTL